MIQDGAAMAQAPVLPAADVSSLAIDPELEQVASTPLLPPIITHTAATPMPTPQVRPRTVDPLLISLSFLVRLFFCETSKLYVPLHECFS